MGAVARAVTRANHLSIMATLAGALSFSTVFVPGGGSFADFAQDATWALVVAAVVLAALASDGAGEPRVKMWIAAGIVLAALRATLLLAFP